MVDEKERYDQEANEMFEKVNSKEDLIEFIQLLAQGYRKGFEEEQPMSEYLGGYAGLVGAVESWYGNQGLEAPERPTWNMMGRLLAAAFAHS